MLAAFRQSEPSAIAAMMRLTHNLKGAAHLAGCSEFSRMVHLLESHLEQLQSVELREDLRQECFLLLRRAISGLATTVQQCRDGLADADQDLRMMESIFGDLQSLYQRCEPVQKDKAIAEEPQQASVAAEDDWGLAAIADVSAPTTAEAVAPPSLPPAQSGSSSDLGWGIFDDSPSDSSTAASLVAAVRTETVAEPMVKPETVTHKARDIESLNQVITAQNSEKVSEKPKKESYLIFHNGNSTFAFPVKYVQEILPNRPHKALPIARNRIAGVISFRGQIMAILQMFDDEKQAERSDPGRCIVVCQIERRQFGFRIDRVSSVIEVDDGVLQPPPGSMSENSIVRSLGQLDGKTVSFIDPRKAI